MESSPENFESLQKLLRLKRHEHPHPRYFNDFSGQVIARIEAGEARVAPRWWQQFGIDLRAALTVGAGAVACLALFFSMASTPEAASPRSGTFAAGGPSIAGSANVAGAPDSFAPPGPQDAIVANSTNPVINAAGIMRLDPWRTHAVPASFQAP